MAASHLWGGWRYVYRESLWGQNPLAISLHNIGGEEFTAW